MPPLTAVEMRLHALLERAAADALADGRAELVVTNQREFWSLPVEAEEGERMLGLLPKAEGAAPVGIVRGEVTDQENGWHLFVGQAPHFEFWEGSEADYERTDAIVRAVVQGRLRQWWSREQVRQLLRPWRMHEYWVEHAEVTLPNDVARSTYAGGGVYPRDGEARETQAKPY